MKIYIDEDMAAGLLVRLLQKAGHDVESPAGTSLLGRSDLCSSPLLFMKTVSA